MENSFEVIGNPAEGARTEDGDRNTKNPGDREISEGSDWRKVSAAKSTALEKFLRGPERGSPPLDNSLPSLLRLCLELMWIAVLVPVEIVKTVYRGFVTVRERDLRDKVVVITGAGNGLGKELALQLAREGCKIACVDINEKSNKVTEEAIALATGRGEDVKSYRCDVSSLKDATRLAGDVLRDFGRVDILVNNAGVLYGHTVTGGSEAIIRRVVDVNLLSNFWMVRAFLPDMQRRRSGRIVFINSGSGINPIEHSSAYCASKSGLLGLAYCVDEELRRNADYDDIRVTTACPYFIATNPEYVRCWKLRMAPIPVSYAASEIVTGIKRDYFLFHVPSVRLGYFLASLMKLMPHEIYKMFKNVFYVDVSIEERSSK